MPASRLQSEHLTAGYESRRVLDGVAFQVEARVIHDPRTHGPVCVPARRMASCQRTTAASAHA